MTETEISTPLDAASLADMLAAATARVASARAHFDETIRTGYTRRSAFLIETGRLKPSTAEELAAVAEAQARLAEAEDACAVLARAAELGLEAMLGVTEPE